MDRSLAHRVPSGQCVWELGTVEELRGAALDVYAELEAHPQPHAKVDAGADADQPAAQQPPGQAAQPAARKPTFCERHQTHFDQLHKGNGNRYHIFTAEDDNEYACVDNGEIVRIPRKE